MSADSVTDAGPGASLANSIRSVPPHPASGCPALRSDAWRDVGTVHGATIEGNETWTAEGSPHRVPDGARIASGGSVTLTPCALVLASAGRAFVVDRGGALFAMGEPARPIVLDAEGATPASGAWQGLSFARDARITSRLVHVRVRHAGADDAALASAMGELDLAHVIVEDARRAGVLLDTGARFANGASDLVVRGTHEGPAVIVRSAEALGSLPNGHFTGNARDEIDVAPTTGDTFVRTSQTWRDVGVPYVVAPNVVVHVEGAGVALVLAPHVTVRFGTGDELRVGEVSDAALSIDAATDPVRFTAADGAWGGIVLGARTDAARTRMHGLVIDGAAGVTPRESLCAPAGIDRAVVQVAFLPDSDLLENLRFEHVPNRAALIARQWIGESRDLVDRPRRVSVTNVADFCVQTAIHETSGACPRHARCEVLPSN
jgi:hypothetical protein